MSGFVTPRLFSVYRKPDLERLKRVWLQKEKVLKYSGISIPVFSCLWRNRKLWHED